MTQATIELLEPFKKHVHTITVDNGWEFAYHVDISKALDAAVYFAYLNRTCGRGISENSNGS